MDSTESVRVVLTGGREAGKTYAGLRPDDHGFLVFQGVSGHPDAWYQIDYDAEPVDTEHGPAQPANYVGEEPTA